MKRSTRADLAKQTVQIVEQGSYTSTGGIFVDIAQNVRECLAATKFYTPSELETLRQKALSLPAQRFETCIEVVNETTLAGISRIFSDNQSRIAALNFASAKNPGGGFLSGSQAQEESLARSSALHASLLQAWEFYEQHRASPSMLYSNAMIVSPACPIFRNDNGELLDEPQLATFITSAAPNAGAAADNRPEEVPHIPNTFLIRSELVLALAASQGIKNLVLGAWGCGVFRNDPHVVAAAFAKHLRNGNWAGRFERVVFSVLDSSPTLDTFTAFERAFC